MVLGNLPNRIYYDKHNFGEGIVYVRREDFKGENGWRLWDQFVDFVSNKSLDVWDTEIISTVLSDDEFLDNTCFRKFPVLKMSDGEYLILSKAYYLHLFYDGIWWEVRHEMEKQMPGGAVVDVLSEDFSEKTLFNGIVSSMIGDNRIRVFNEHSFDRQQSIPDMAIKTRHHLFLFEYKDMRVEKSVADGSDIDKMMLFLEDRLNKKKGASGANKGIPQLIRNMEDFFTGKEPWGASFRKGSIVLQPIIVVNSRLFGVRGINYILQEKMNQRILQSDVLKEHKNQIAKLLVLDLDSLILLAARSYKNFAVFQNACYSYQSYLQKQPSSFAQYDSFKIFIINLLRNEKENRRSRVFEKGYKAIVRGLSF